MNKEETIVNVVALTVGAAVGFGIGYFVQKRKYESWFAQDRLQQDAREKAGVFSTPQGAVRELHGEEEVPEEIIIEDRPMTREEVNELLVDAGYAPLNGEDTYDATQVLEETGIAVEADEDTPDDGFEIQVTGEEIMESIWSNSLPLEDEPVSSTENEDTNEMPSPDPDRPYIITVDQFMQDEQYDDNKFAFVYFEGDDQMIDEREQLVNDIEGIVGHANLQRFGLGSRDRNALYIRSDAKKMDIEIIRDKRTYQEVVLGIKPEVTMGDKVRRMRANDQ